LSVAQSVLEIRDLSLAFGDGESPAAVLERVSLTLRAGSILGIVGESGSGKTLTARSVLRLLPAGARVTDGQILFEGRDLLTLSETQLRDVRGAQIGMIFQEPMTTLNPALRVGRQLEEGLRRHTGLDGREIRERVLDMLGRVGMPDPHAVLTRFPHEFSGGMRQRLVIASVMSLRPRVLIADEPTTALDAIIARQVLEVMVSAARSADAAVMLVSHDLSAVCRYAEHVAVMRSGRVLEIGPTERVLMEPGHAYTRALLEAMPRRRTVVRQPQEGVVAEVERLRVRYASRRRWPWSPEPAPVLRDVSLRIRRGETFAVVGESGSGKTTLGRTLLGLLPASAGRVVLLGSSLRAGQRLAPELRRRAQLVFQDPYASLDPRMRVAALISEGLRNLPHVGAEERRRRVDRMLAAVGLAPELARRFPHELSGGQRQRVVIARSLVTEPDLLVADEPVSALDLTVQAQVLKLLERLQEQLGFSMLFVSHDLAVVARIADRIAVVRAGRIVECGAASAILDRPAHPYTRELWAAFTRIVPAGTGFRLDTAEAPRVATPAGHRFAAADDADDVLRMLPISPAHEVLCAQDASD
jgi:peptide/nickel transport system ATP-binding protein